MSWRLAAAELSAAYAAGRLDPAAVLEEVLARVAAVNPFLNAIVTRDEAGARAAARESAARWRAGLARGPLDGIPITVKDNLWVGGLRATWGSRVFADHVAPRDDLPVAALREAGAVILGKTNTPELALSGITDNPVFGVTRNPWDTSRTPGGSSGGAAAAVASGMGPIAVCTDAGGSTRRPAAHTGLLGLKPAPARIPRRHGFPALTGDFQSIGLLARSVADLRAAFAVTALPGAPGPGAAPLRIGVIRGVGDAPIETSTLAAFDVALRALEAAGHRLTDRAAPWDAEEVAALFARLGAAGVHRALRAIPGAAELVTPPIRAQYEAGAALPAADLLDAQDAVQALRRRVGAALDGVDALAMP
ncbi:MAG: amidase, partial [Acetobacteraceae bacterium]|nr:amidase [Acetobacteraceae bacterium]